MRERYCTFCLTEYRNFHISISRQRSIRSFFEGLHSSWSFPTALTLSAKLSIYYLRVVLRIQFFEFCYSEMWFAHSRKCLSESLFGHTARYAPSQTFKKTLLIAPNPYFRIIRNTLMTMPFSTIKFRGYTDVYMKHIKRHQTVPQLKNKNFHIAISR